MKNENFGFDSYRQDYDLTYIVHCNEPFCAGGIMNYFICYHKEQKDPAENKILSFCGWFAKKSYIRLRISKHETKIATGKIMQTIVYWMFILHKVFMT